MDAHALAPVGLDDVTRSLSA
ncbi:hypothetical protein VTO73DRAFT_15577 [Trametes versicolor]